MEEKKKRPLTKKQKAAFERRRRKGYAKYIREKRKEIAKKKRKEEKEKARLKKIKEKEKKKRPVGRPKKRGPKKKRKKIVLVEKKTPGRKLMPPYKYKIISCRNGIQNKFIGKYRSIEDAYDVFNKLKKLDKHVNLPSVITWDSDLNNSIDEYIIIEKSDTNTSILRNEYGKLVEHVLNKDGWIVIDKYRYLREELFWVFGYDSRKDRKDVVWIYNNLVLFESDIYNFKRLLLYKNKLVIKDDFNHIDLVLCKDESDAIRLYNKIEEWVKIDKIKNILFIGNFSKISDKRKKLEEELIVLTGWPKKKIQMKNTTYYNANKKIKI